MSTYTVEADPEGDGWWMVSMRHQMPIYNLTRAQAEVIAFAFNALADGKVLGSPYPPTEENDGMYRYGGMYSGPTTGIKLPGVTSER